MALATPACMGSWAAELDHDVSLARATVRWLRLHIIGSFECLGEGTMEK